MAPKELSRRSLLMPWRRPASEGASREQPPQQQPKPCPPAQTVPRSSPALLPLPALPPLERPVLTFILRPPGALPEPAFLDACHRCGRCVEACPVEAIALIGSGPAAGTPHIDASQTACALCDGLACARACPSGALLPVASKAAVRMGTALIDPGRCTAYRGLPCRICVEVCPVPGVLRLAKGQRAYVPIAAAEACVGCGTCEQHCPAAGAIRIVAALEGGDGRVRFSGLGPDASQGVQ